MSEPTKKPPYPDNCPQCENTTGWPVSAGTCDRPGVIVVKLKCQQCGHEWVADAPKPASASVSWPRRPDRRRDWPKLGVL